MSTKPGLTRRYLGDLRPILVENARRKGRKKRGGERVRVELDAVAPATSPSNDNLLDLDEQAAGRE
jgi:hypothetical protein